MPAAFKHTGLIPGCIGTALVGVIATHCVHILVILITVLLADFKNKEVIIFRLHVN
ncbi:hypothetical protein RR48_00219 [Papilio machaon]|uniref:Uncharacterized protein n=1 Tax=Papilio machaon TaxID=76193 RepID=A0A0N1IEV4_PAPMA|nr:hypothetical protein RR48_00219 [Papilio machaon]